MSSSKEALQEIESILVTTSFKLPLLLNDTLDKYVAKSNEEKDNLIDKIKSGDITVTQMKKLRRRKNVTRTDIIVEALEAYFKMKKFTV